LLLPGAQPKNPKGGTAQRENYGREFGEGVWW